LSSAFGWRENSTQIGAFSRTVEETGCPIHCAYFAQWVGKHEANTPPQNGINLLTCNSALKRAIFDQIIQLLELYSGSNPTNALHPSGCSQTFPDTAPLKHNSSACTTTDSPPKVRLEPVKISPRKPGTAAPAPTALWPFRCRRGTPCSPLWVSPRPAAGPRKGRRVQ
jgi:hypothetical protein